MKYRPLPSFLVMLLCGLVTTPVSFASGGVLAFAPGPDFMALSGQGYLGVDLGEIDSERATALHLNDTHGAEVTMIDHDAPAAKSGLKVHDVIVQVDGQSFDTAEQLRHRLREMTAGQTVALLVSRDGNRLNMTVQLCDRSRLQHQAWVEHLHVPGPASASIPGVDKSPSKSFLGKAPAAGPNFLASVLPRTLYTGAEVNPVHAQLAGYFGVTSGTGLLVENVNDQSPAAHAGIRAGDVIIWVEAQPMKSRGDWQKATRKYRGQPVRVTVMRNKQQQVLTMIAGKPKRG